MIGIKGMAEVPRECFDCPFQLRFQHDCADEWYNRRCVILHKTIQYPKLEDCPLVDMHKEFNMMIAMIDEPQTYEGVNE